MMRKKNTLVRLVLVTVLVVMMFVAVPLAGADTGTDTSALRDAITLAGVRAHQAAFQTIADANGGTRVSGTAGYDESADYVRAQLEAAGYTVSYQEFDFNFFQVIGSPSFEQVTPTPTTYVDQTDFDVMTYSGSGTTGTVNFVPVDLSIANPSASTSGCETTDFPTEVSGHIALIQRGTCTFGAKAQNAQAAGAVGAVIFNQGTADRLGLLFGTLGAPGVTIPVVGTTFAIGEELAAGATGSLDVQTVSEVRTTHNVIAETSGGRTDRVVVVGAHLDSVPEGPGINDNGSGSAAILEIALQMAALGIEPRNQVRFIWFGAEESNLIGSTYYVSQLTNRQIKDIAVMLNFDMIGSPNFVRFVYDGDGSATGIAGPNGSGVVEDVFIDYFASQGLANEPTAFSGRSDYGPFIAVGIPAGGLFTGAEGIKTAEQAAIYGGTAGIQYDPCYHQACDTFANNSNEALEQMSDATAHTALTFAMTTSSVNGTDKGKGKGSYNLEYLGSDLQK